MANGGQVYVKVQADTSTYSARSSVGSGGSTSLGVTIKWSFDGGISGQYGWDNPRQVNYVDGNVEQTNAAVALAYQGASLSDLIAIVNCVNIN